MTSIEKEAFWEAYKEYILEEFGEESALRLQEYDMEKELSNGIGLMYTTTEDGKHELQATVYPYSLELVCEVDWQVVAREKFASVEEMIDGVFYPLWGTTWSEMENSCIDGGIKCGIITEQNEF